MQVSNVWVAIPHTGQQGADLQYSAGWPNFQHLRHCLGFGVSSRTVTFSNPIRTLVGIVLLSKVMQARVRSLFFLEVLLYVVTFDTGMF